MQNIGEWLFVIIGGSFFLHFLGLIPLISLWVIFGDKKVDNFYLFRKIEEIKSPDLRQIIYFPILSVMGGLFLVVLGLYVNFCRSHSTLQNIVLGLSVLGYLILLSRKNYLTRKLEQTLI
jgi:hypothetical protein